MSDNVEYYSKKQKVIYKFNAYWDKEYIPLCVCRTPLVSQPAVFGKELSDAYCDKCKKAMPLYDDTGTPMTIREAMELILPPKTR